MMKVALSHILPLCAIFAMLLGIQLGPAVHANAAYSGLFDVTGVVSGADGGPAAGVSVSATDPGGLTVQYGPVSTSADGSYDLQAAAGKYDIQFDPRPAADRRRPSMPGMSSGGAE
jgi:hypothetical protein